MTNEQRLAVVTELVDRIRTEIPKTRSGVKPDWKWRKYRGKAQWVVGYWWTKPYSHFLKGRVHETVLGWGPTFEAAVDRAKRRTDREGVANG
jgi:hypothetical protein